MRAIVHRVTVDALYQCSVDIGIHLVEKTLGVDLLSAVTMLQ